MSPVPGVIDRSKTLAPLSEKIEMAMDCPVLHGTVTGTFPNVSWNCRLFAPVITEGWLVIVPLAVLKEDLV